MHGTSPVLPHPAHQQPSSRFNGLIGPAKRFAAGWDSAPAEEEN